MKLDYKVCVNLEISSKCNADCAMCPRELIPQPQVMPERLFRNTLERIGERDVHRVVLAGYGEPTVHPKFPEFMDAIRTHPCRFDLVTNGSLLSEERLRALDGAIDTMIVSFSSVDRSVYERVHVGLTQSDVMEGIKRANDLLRSTRLAISLSPLRPCIDTLPETIDWFRSLGIDALSMSPTVYDRATGAQVGGMDAPDTRELRSVMKDYGLASQEFDFIPSLWQVGKQWLANRFKCMPRNVDVLISADGQYMYCFNDIQHRRRLGHVEEMSLRDALHLREQSPADPTICDGCSMRGRYGLGEVSRMLHSYLLGAA